MGPIDFWRRGAALHQYKDMQAQVGQNRANGMNEIAADAALILQTWGLSDRLDELAPKAVTMATNLRLLDDGLVIGMLLFARRTKLSKQAAKCFASDFGFDRYGYMMGTASVFNDFASATYNRMCDEKRVPGWKVHDATFAAFYSSLINPAALDSWSMLKYFDDIGVRVPVDCRDHEEEGAEEGRVFLANCPDADPELTRLIERGVQLLS